jgi:O-antigen/teichoic acid export membrane protein
MFSDYVQVGYFGLAHSLYLAAAATLTQVTTAFVPMLSTSFEEGRTGALSAWAGHVSRYLAIAAVLAVFGSVLLGPTVVRVLLGAEYQPVADNLVLLSAALLPLTLASAPAAFTVVQERPRPMLIAAAVRLIAFWIVAPPAVARWGSLGACLAVLVAVAVHSVWLTWSLRDLIGGSLRQWLGPVAFGALWLPLLWCRSSPLADALLYVLFLLTYGGGLLLTGLVKPRELSRMAALLRWSALRRGWPAVGGP